MLEPATTAQYAALARWLAGRVRDQPCPVVGINGAQGSGKTTLVRFLVDELASAHGLRAALLSLDDFYLPRAERLRLARDVHPLLATRGVPGTHDPALGLAVLQALRAPGRGEPVALPRFEKALDDRLPPAAWPRLTGLFDLVLFEGWCVGTPMQDARELPVPVNALEAGEDAEGRWRRYVNAQLGGAYASWFAAIGTLIFLAVPDFDSVRRWRRQQEEETARRHGGGRGLMTPAQIERFIAHYERLTRHALRVLPARADAVLELDRAHGVAALRLR